MKDLSQRLLFTLFLSFAVLPLDSFELYLDLILILLKYRFCHFYRVQLMS